MEPTTKYFKVIPRKLSIGEIKYGKELAAKEAKKAAKRTYLDN